MTRPFCNPLRFDGEPMSREAFLDLRHVPGFKYEYFNGKASVSVQRSVCPTVASTPERLLSRVDGRSLSDEFTVGPASEASVETLQSLWGEAFLQTPDYHGYSLDAIQEDARETLHALFEGSAPALHPASAIARRNGTLVGALLVTTAKARPCIDALFLRRPERRRGLASAMLRRVAEHLQKEKSGVLCSGYLLANAGSAAWHSSVGFVELPDWLTENHRYKCIQHNVHQGLIRDPFSARRRATTLRAQVASMRADRREDPSAHVPFRWIETNGDRIDEALERHLDEGDTASPQTTDPPA